MAMISYAQNFEDVMLARVFAGQSDGFYIDVGVCDPHHDSVTKHFYDSGWYGVNVEPLFPNYQRIAKARQRDITLHTAAGRSQGKLVFHEVEGTGLSTMDPSHAERHRSDGYEVRQLEVPVTTLAAICEQHVGDRVVDFLKIDVEGAEGDVVAGANWQRWRPRVVLIEATLPRSSQLAALDWEPALTGCGYTRVYFDGLNCWYVRQEDEALTAAFSVPPNVFDDFVLARTSVLEDQVRDLSGRVAVLEQRLRSALTKADRLDVLGGTLLGKIAIRLS